MPDDILTIREAAAYLGYSVANIKHHLYVSHNLTPDGKFGTQVCFRRSTLGAFMREPSHRGRPTPNSLKGQTLAWLRQHAEAGNDPDALARACAIALHHPRWVKYGAPEWVYNAAAKAIAEATNAQA
jgi:hypothetical protein